MPKSDRLQVKLPQTNDINRQHFSTEMHFFTRYNPEEIGFFPHYASPLVKHNGKCPAAQTVSGDAKKWEYELMKVAIFSTKPYDRAFPEQGNIALQSGHEFQFLEARLEPETAELGGDCKAVCAFVNDTLDRTVLEILKGRDVRLELGLWAIAESSSQVRNLLLPQDVRVFEAPLPRTCR